MPYSRLGALRQCEPAKWKAEIRHAMREADGDIGRASEALGVSRRQLARWLAELRDIPRRPRGHPYATEK